MALHHAHNGVAGCIDQRKLSAALSGCSSVFKCGELTQVRAVKEGVQKPNKGKKNSTLDQNITSARLSASFCR